MKSGRSLTASVKKSRMSSIQTEQIAVDTNEFIFAIRRTEARDSSFRLLYDHISALAIYVPLQVHLEIQRNLSPIEYVEFKKLIGMALNIEHGTGRPSPGSIARFEKRGAKKGDTLIAEELVDKGVRWLI